jgi:putative transposase
MRFRFIEDRRADYPVRIMCRVLDVSPAGYYAWRSRPESPRTAANRELLEHIKRVHRDSHGRYGSPRIHVELKAQGHLASRGRIERQMRHHAVRAISAGPRRCRTTDSGHGFPIAPNLLGRNFSAAMRNQVWLADITFVSGPARAGCIWRPSWICTAAVSWAGRWTTICAQNCRSRHYEWRSRGKDQVPG